MVTEGNGNRKGIVLAGGAGTRLNPLTIACSKQILPVYDKPMIYYPLSILMFAGIREVLVISTPRDLPLFKNLLGDGSQFGLDISYAKQPKPEGLPQAFVIAEEWLAGSSSMLVLGDNFLYGTNLPSTIRKVGGKSDGAAIFGYRVANPRAYGVVEVDSDGKPLSLEEKPDHPKSDYTIPGFYFFDETAPQRAKSLTPSGRNELEITDLLRSYKDEDKLSVELLGRGIAWLDTGTHDELLDASSFVKTIQTRQGTKISCLEEIAYRRGWISIDQLREQVEQMGVNDYSGYLRREILDKAS